MPSPEQPSTPTSPVSQTRSEPLTGPPVAARRPVTTHHHGHERTDDYEWLRAKDDPEVLELLEAENAWTAQRTEHLAGLRNAIFGEIKARTRETDLSVPTRNRGWWYYGRSFEGRQYGASCRVPVTDPDDWTPPTPAENASPDSPALPGEQVLLDSNELAEGHDFFSLGGSALAHDAGLLAYATDTTGDERYTIRVKELATGDLLPDVITGALGGATWHPDGTSFYYTTVDDSWRADKIWQHTLGTAQADDTLVHHETDERFWVGVGRSRTDRFVMVASGSKTTSEYRVLDVANPEQGFVVFAERREGLEYTLEHAVLGGQDRFLVLHNLTGEDFELGSAATTPTAPEDWTALIPHTAGVRLEDVDAFATHLVVHQRSEGLTQLRLLDLDGDGVSRDHLVEFSHEVHTIGSAGNPEFTQPTVRLGYTTLAVPPSVHDYDVRSGELRLLRTSPVEGGYDPADYTEHRLWATSADGTRVPISLVARVGVDPTHGPAPLSLYGYGAYEASMDPWFSVARLSLLDRGAVFAIAHVRGGGEMGRHWYTDGKLQAKQHTFDDFIACARHLVETGWTTADVLVAEGGSAGGLLMGAVANQAPEAFGGIVAEVPFVDTLTTMLDPTLPLTVTEYDEWGNPTDDPAAYETIAGYAPYDNVAARSYPPILAETSLHDTRVLYVEPAKWVAKLRRVAGADVLLRTEMAAGHGGVSGRYKAWEDRAFTLAWMLDRMGLAGVTPASGNGADAS